MVSRADIVAEAREWIGTKFQHQQRSKGMATDCIGLVGGVAIECGALPRDPLQLPGIGKYLGYGRLPDGRLMQALDEYLTRITREQMAPGDVVVCRWGKDPQHLGIVGDWSHGGLSIIHAENYRHQQVIEHRLWFDGAMHFVAAYRIPGVE